MKNKNLLFGLAVIFTMAGCGSSKSYQKDLVTYELKGYVLNEGKTEEDLKVFSGAYRKLKEKVIYREVEIHSVNFQKGELEDQVKRLEAARLRLAPEDAKSLSEELKPLNKKLQALEDERIKIEAEKNKANDGLQALEKENIAEKLEMTLRVYRDALSDEIRGELNIQGREESIQLGKLDYDDKKETPTLHFNYTVPTETVKKEYEVVVDAEAPVVEVASQEGARKERIGKITLKQADKIKYGEISLVIRQDLKVASSADEKVDEKKDSEKESVKKEDQGEKKEEEKPKKISFTEKMEMRKHLFKLRYGYLRNDYTPQQIQQVVGDLNVLVARGFGLKDIQDLTLYELEKLLKSKE